MALERDSGRPGNPDRLRAKIDRGQTRDKVPWRDPAAAPLGTDDEAAGTPPSAAKVAEAIRTEAASSGVRPSPFDAGPNSTRLVAIYLTIASVCAIVLLAAVYALLR